MANKITEKYFSQKDFSRREKEVLAEITKKSGFVVDEEIYRGVIYERTKVGSLIYRGRWRKKPAVLKIQGLKPEVDEGRMIRLLNAQNQSRIVRAPRLYAHQPWSAKRGYGYLIIEYIDAPKIFKMPFAAPEQMNEFARFYQEYRTSVLTSPWLEPEDSDSLSFTVRRIEHWREISESKKRLRLQDYAPCLMRYYPIAVEHLPSIPMTFCHGHLSAEDVFRLPDGSLVILSNLFWSYRPQYYDLAFNIWACLQHIRDTNYSFAEMLRYVNDWLAAYRRIPVVRSDGDFERKITVLLAERTVGAILVDLGVNDWYDKQGNKKYFHHLLDLHQRLFDHLAGSLEETRQ